MAAQDDELLGDGGGLLIGSFGMAICLFGCIGFIRFKTSPLFGISYISVSVKLVNL